MKLILSVTLFSLLSSFCNGQEKEQDNSKLRFMVKGENAKIAAQSSDGRIVLETKSGITAVEFDDLTQVKNFRFQAAGLGVDIEVDQIRRVIPTERHPGGNTRRLAETIPWGIGRTYERDGVVDIPDDSYFPDTAVHPICVIDSGYDVDHPDLPNDAEGTTNNWSNDQCEHGTHVAGTIAAIGGNDVGVVGVWPGAPDIKVARVFRKFIGLCLFSYSSDLIGAVEDCQASGAKITTMSLGGPTYSNFERQAFQDLYDDGMLHIAAAGNGGNSACSYPACYESVMSVGATDINDDIAYFSQYNSQTEISAPGVDVDSTVPNNKYDNYDGTSMATPHVSGAALVLWNKLPSSTNVEVRAALNAGAIDLGTLGYDVYYGNGLLNYWRSYDILSGAVNNCVDSEVPIYFDGNTVSCDTVEENGSCADPRAASHCPLTCNACEQYECEDSLAPLLLTDKEVTCADIANSNQLDEACSYDVVASTCRETCDYCN